MRWRIGALLALASTLVVGYWEAIVPHPGAEPRLVARAAAGGSADLGPLEATLISVTRGKPGDPGTPQGIPASALVLTATVDLTPAAEALPAATACELRVAAADGREWVPVAQSAPCGGSAGEPVTAGVAARRIAWFVVPPGVDLGGMSIEVRTTGAEPLEVLLQPGPIS